MSLAVRCFSAVERWLKKLASGAPRTASSKWLSLFKTKRYIEFWKYIREQSLGNDPFPNDLFAQTDEGRCRVCYNYDNFGNRYFWLELAGDEHRRRFYFSPPESLDHAAVFGSEVVLNEKERVFRVLKVNIQINGISRRLLLRLDEGWLEAARHARW